MSLLTSSLDLSQNGVPYLSGVSLEFDRGGLSVILGRTLAGKSTLLRVIAGFQSPDSGELRLDGELFSKLPPWKRDVAMVYQEFVNYPHLTAFDNVAFPLRKRRVERGELNRRVSSVLARVGLEAVGDSKPSELSGGQQQRVALARALVREADILLLDEPLVNLDYKLREQLRGDFRDLLSGQPRGIVIYTTTDPAEAMMLGDRVIVMHEGRVVQVGLPEEVFESPASISVAEVINDPPMNIFEGALEGSDVLVGKDLRLTAPSRLRALAPGQYKFGLRASDLDLESRVGLEVRVTYSEVSGSETTLRVKGDFGEAIVQFAGVRVVRLGSSVRVAIPPERLFVFEATGAGALVSAPLTGGGR